MQVTALPRGWSPLGGLAVLCVLSVGVVPAAMARPEKPGNAAGARRASQLIVQGTQALDAGDAAAAELALSDAYRAAPSTEALYLLGRAAWAQGRKTAGRDFLRRFLADPSSEADSAQGQQAQRLLAEPAEPSGEVRVLGESNAKVLVNDHIVGTLPLTLPLLLPVGTHKLTVEANGRRLEEQVKIVAGHSTELRFRSETGVIVATVPPAVAVLTFLPGASAADTEALTTAVAQIVRRAKLELFHFELAPSSLPELSTCTESLACQRELAARQALDYVLTVRLPKPSGTAAPQLVISLLDPAVDELASHAERDCGPCTAGALLGAVQDAADKVIVDGASRPRGTLELKSTPPGVEVWLGDKKLGVTPLTKVMWAARYELSLRRPGFMPQQVQVGVSDAKQETVESTLEPDPAKLIAKPVIVEKFEERTTILRRKRPLSRLIAGGVVTGLGALGIGFGSDALYFEGKCEPDGRTPITDCGASLRYHTAVAGSVLLGLGSAALLTGVVLLAVPGKSYKNTVRVRVAKAAEPASP